MASQELHWADYLVFSLFLVSSLCIGLYHACTGGKQKTTKEFLLADRKLRVIPTMLSLLVSFQSAIMILGHAAEMYTRGVQQWLLGLFGFTMAIIVAERLFVPWLYPMKLTSVYEFLEMRFNSKLVRSIGAVLGVFQGILYMGLAMFAPSIALEAATGFPVHASIPLMAVVCTIYTAIGGMRAVIWTDVFQFGIMLTGMLAVWIKATVAAGGFARVFELNAEEGRMLWADFSPDPRVRHTFWGLSLSWGFGWSFTYGISQASIQRYAATPSEKHARMVLLSNIPPLIVMTSVAFLTGISMLGYFASIKCDPLASGQVENANQIIAYMVVTLFADLKGFSGLFLATLYSGALSSVSSTLTASAAIMWEDVFKIKLKPKMSEYQATVFNKALVVVYGIFAAGVAYLCLKIPGPITQVAISMMGAVGGPTFGLFLLGGSRFLKRANWKGASAGVAISFVFMMWIGFGAQTLKGHEPPLPPVSTSNCSSPSTERNVTYVAEPIYQQQQQQEQEEQAWTVDSVLSTAIPQEAIPLKGIENLYAVSYVWYSPIGCFITLVLGMIVSLITEKIWPEEERKLPDHLFIPTHKLFWWSCRETPEDDSIDTKPGADADEKERDPFIAIKTKPENRVRFPVEGDSKSESNV